MCVSWVTFSVNYFSSHFDGVGDSCKDQQRRVIWIKLYLSLTTPLALLRTVNNVHAHMVIIYVSVLGIYFIVTYEYMMSLCAMKEHGGM